MPKIIASISLLFKYPEMSQASERTNPSFLFEERNKWVRNVGGTGEFTKASSRPLVDTQWPSTV